MVFHEEKQRGGLIRLLGIVSAALFLAGCAGTSSSAAREDPAARDPDPDQHVVVGQGTAEDRAAINASNQKMFNAEHADSPAATSTAPPDPVPLQRGSPQ